MSYLIARSSILCALTKLGRLVAAFGSLLLLGSFQSWAEDASGGEGENPEALFIAAMYATSMKDWSTAADLFKQVLSIRPKDNEALHNLALALRHQGRYEDALHGFELCLRLMPKDDARIEPIRLEVARIQRLVNERGDRLKMMLVRGGKVESFVPVNKETLMTQSDFESCNVENVDGQWRLEMKLTDAGYRKSLGMAKRFFGRPLIFVSQSRYIMTISCVPGREGARWIVQGRSEAQVRKWHEYLLPSLPFKIYLMYHSLDPDKDQKAYMISLIDMLKRHKEDLTRFELHLLSEQLKMLSARMGLDKDEEMESMIKMAQPVRPTARSLYEIVHGRGDFATDIFASEIHKEVSDTEKRTLVVKLQKKLQSKGFDPGPFDGLVGKKTCQALLDYQNASGLNASGILDSETFLMLELNEGSTSGSETGPLSRSSSIPSSPAAYLETLLSLDHGKAQGGGSDSVTPGGLADNEPFIRVDDIPRIDEDNAPKLPDYLYQMEDIVFGFEARINTIRDVQPVDFNIESESSTYTKSSNGSSRMAPTSGAKTSDKGRRGVNKSASKTPSSQEWEERFRAAAKKFESRRPK